MVYKLVSRSRLSNFISVAFLQENSMFTVLHRTAIVLICVSFVSIVYLYQYPLFNACAFPTQDEVKHSPTSAWDRVRRHLGGSTSLPHLQAPFRLLALGDPQLEGDTSLPDPEDGYCSSLTTSRADVVVAPYFPKFFDLLGKAGSCLILQLLPSTFGLWRKRLDLFGNDYYLAHIYRTVYQHTKPTHVTVLGDLLGSQWIDDDEFEWRGWRYWQRVFWQGTKVESELTDLATSEILGEDMAWARRIINIAGNHDVGYAGDMTVEGVERFERVFGKANWEITFRLPQKETQNGTYTNQRREPELRIVILNSLNLDTLALDEGLQGKTYNFINEVISRSKPVEDRTTGTILLTHLPLHKESGVCVDSPFFDFHPSDAGGGVKEQNHLSYHSGKGILEGIFGMSGNPDSPGHGFGRNGIILTGHDHEGCDVYHHLPQDEDIEARHWNATRWRDAIPTVDEPIPGIREITVRSMMGDFGGNAGLLSAWFDDDIGEWRFAYSTCSVGVQHIWWAIHVLVLVTLGFSASIFSMKWLNKGPSISIGDGIIQQQPATAESNTRIRPPERKVDINRSIRKRRA